MNPHLDDTARTGGLQVIPLLTDAEGDAFLTELQAGAHRIAGSGLLLVPGHTLPMIYLAPPGDAAIRACLRHYAVPGTPLGGELDTRHVWTWARTPTALYGRLHLEFYRHTVQVATLNVYWAALEHLGTLEALRRGHQIGIFVGPPQAGNPLATPGLVLCLADDPSLTLALTWVAHNGPPPARQRLAALRDEMDHLAWS